MCMYMCTFEPGTSCCNHTLMKDPSRKGHCMLDLSTGTTATNLYCLQFLCSEVPLQSLNNVLFLLRLVKRTRKTTWLTLWDQRMQLQSRMKS